VTLEAGLALGGSFIAIITAIVAPALIVGRYLGSILTTQVAHTTEITSLKAGVADKGVRIEQLGNAFAEFRGEMRGRLSRGDLELSGRVRE
jgi:hypothetical protein